MKLTRREIEMYLLSIGIDLPYIKKIADWILQKQEEDV